MYMCIVCLFHFITSFIEMCKLLDYSGTVVADFLGSM